jgi:hypothetical protein
MFSASGLVCFRHNRPVDDFNEIAADPTTQMTCRPVAAVMARGEPDVACSLRSSSCEAPLDAPGHGA